MQVRGGAAKREQAELAVGGAGLGPVDRGERCDRVERERAEAEHRRALACVHGDGAEHEQRVRPGHHHVIDAVVELLAGAASRGVGHEHAAGAERRVGDAGGGEPRERHVVAAP